MIFKRIDDIRRAIEDSLKQGLMVSNGASSRLISFTSEVPVKELNKVIWKAAAMNSADERAADEIGMEIATLWRDCVQAHIERGRGSESIDALEALSTVPLRHMRAETLGMSKVELSASRPRVRP